MCEYLLQGMSNKQIAFEMHLAEGTIKEYMNRAFRKAGVVNRTGLAIWFAKFKANQDFGAFGKCLHAESD